jgi:peptidyl-tRNA hydrolase
MINAQQIAELIDVMIKDILTEKVYPYGNPQFGMGNKVASGSLRNSIEVKVLRRNSDIAIELFANDYWQWVQSGRAKGKKGVPIPAILAWMKNRGITAKDKTNEQYGALQSQVATAYIINKARIKKGKHALPMDVLLKWVKDNNIKFNIDLEKGMAFAIQKNIKKFGIRPANIEDKLFDKILESEQITTLLGDVAFEDFVNMIEYNLTANTK